MTLGLTYTFSIWVRKNAGYTESNTDIKIEWLDAGRAHLGSVITNITGQAGTNYTKFKISGSTDSDRCKYIRVVAATAWSNAMPQASMQFDDAYLETEPGTVLKYPKPIWNLFAPPCCLFLWRVFVSVRSMGERPRLTVSMALIWLGSWRRRICFGFRANAKDLMTLLAAATLELGQLLLRPSWKWRERSK